MRIIQEAELNHVPMRVFLEAVRAQIIDDANGKAVAPPRHHVDFDPGALVFTCGGNKDLAGFRVYDTFDKPEGTQEDQIVVAFDRHTAKLKGITIGERIGPIRTGCLGGVAIDRMVRQTRIEKLALIGTGVQARAQIEAILSVRDVAKVSVFSRSLEKRTEFAAELARKFNLNITPAANAERVVNDADVVVLATNSSTPVVETKWIKQGAHVTTVGPKFVGRHELPLDIVERAKMFVSDSPQQILGQGDKHMFHDHQISVQHLGDAEFSTSSGDVSVFLSAGLAGTEVAALGAAIDFLDKQDGSTTIL